MLPGSERWRIVVTTPTQPRPERTAAGTRTLLVVDQFEELVTALSPMLQEEYADWLADAAAEDEMTVVVAVRSDYYAQAAAHPRLSDLLAGNTVLVGEMASDELRQAVEQPATAAGLELEPGLAETVAGDVSGEPGGLPLMSTALLSLWERRDGRRLSLATYREMGGVRTAVARLAETAYGQLTPSQQSVARRTLLRLAETGEGGEPVRRRVPIAEVAPDRDADARAVLGTLAARRLLTVSETHAEVAHEALLREWPRLRAWLDEDEAGRTLRRHLGPAAREWQAGGRQASELYRGPRLAAALEWQRDHPDDLTEVEHDFLRTGREAADAEALRRRRSIRRLRSLAVGLTGVLMLALVAGLVAVDQRNDAARSSFAADVRALQAEAHDENRWDRALLFAAQAQRFDASPESRAALLQTLQRGPEATAIFAADQPLHSLATSGDGTRLVAGGRNGTLYVWDTAERRSQEIPDVTAFWPAPLDISPDGRYVAAVGVPLPLYEEKRFLFHVMVVDLEKTPPAVRFLENAPAAAARFAVDGRTIVTVDEDGRIRYLDVATGVVQRTFDVKVASPGSVVLGGPGNRRFLAASWQQAPGQVVAWEVDSGRQVWSSVEPDGVVAGISPDGSTLVIGHADGRIDRIDVKSGTRTPVASSLAEGLVSVVWAPDGSTFAGVTTERTVLVWDAETMEARAILRGHWGNVSEATYSSDSKTLYAAGFDRAVLAWDVTGTRGIVTDVLDQPGTDVATALFQSPIAALAPDASVAATAHPGRRLVLTDTATAESFEVTLPGEGEINWVHIDRLGRTALASVGPLEYKEAGVRWTWHAIDLRRREVLPYTIESDVQIGGDAVVTWDNNAVLVAGEQQVGLWDLATGTPKAVKLFEAARAVSAIGVHPGGRIAALSEVDGVIEIIDLTTGDLVATLNPGDALGERIALGSVAFSPDGRWFAGATSSGDVVVWDTRMWQQHSTWEASVGAGVRSLVFTPDSDFIVAGGTGTAAIWNVAGSGEGVRLDVDPIRPDTQVVVGIKDDGQALVTFTEGTGVREWTVEPGRLLEHACVVAGRNLTQQEWADVLPDRPYERTCREYPDG
jgi:WD40 repeat protein